MAWRTIVAALSVGFSQQAALAQYPSKPVRVVVPYPAGGAVDSFARVLTQQLSELWGQSVVVENRPGASTMIGAEQVAKSPADGYTLLLTAELTLVTVPHLYEKVPYDPLRDFAPITALVSATQALVANPSLPVTTVNDVVTLAKAKPGELTYGSFGVGSTGHLNMEVFQAMTGTRFNHIPYSGAGPAMNDVVGGHVSLMFAALSIVKGSVRRKFAHDRCRKRSAKQRISRRAYDFRVGRAGFSGKILVWPLLRRPKRHQRSSKNQSRRDQGDVGPDFCATVSSCTGPEPIRTPDQFAASRGPKRRSGARSSKTRIILMIK
jgi:hypothetical protein